MARSEALDTTVLIQIIRDQRAWPALHQAIRKGRIWLSSVVVAEIYAGNRSRDDARFIREIADAMQGIDRVITPTADEWRQAGQLINRRVRLQGDLRPRDHLADLLILLSAARLNGTVITANLRQFDAWAELARESGLEVGAAPLEALGY